MIEDPDRRITRSSDHPITRSRRLLLPAAPGRCRSRASCDTGCCARRRARRRCARCSRGWRPARAGCSRARTDRAPRAAAADVASAASGASVAGPFEEGQVRQRDHLARHHDHQPLDHVAQLAHVAGPAVAAQAGRRAAVEVLRAAPVLARELADEVLGRAAVTSLSRSRSGGTKIGMTLRRK